jgi:hypothetical protein
VYFPVTDDEREMPEKQVKEDQPESAQKTIHENRNILRATVDFLTESITTRLFIFIVDFN